MSPLPSWASLAAGVDTLAAIQKLAIAAVDIAIAHVVSAANDAVSMAGGIAVTHACAQRGAAWSKVRRAVVDVYARIVAVRATARMAGAGAVAIDRARPLALHVAIAHASARVVAGVTAGRCAVVEGLAGSATIVAAIDPAASTLTIPVAVSTGG